MGILGLSIERYETFIGGGLMSFIGRRYFFVVSNFLMFSVSLCINVETRVFNGQRLGCDKDKIQEIDFFKTAQGTAVSVLEDKKGKKFIVKQKTHKRMRDHVSVARDMLGVFVARSVDILANDMEIIPAFYHFPGKRDIRFPASLHVFVSGIQVCKLPTKLSKFDIEIKQAAKKGISQPKCGLTRRIIHNIAKHEDLPALVALDTFIANGDRNRKNFFYDQDIHRFFSIDFASSFRKNIAAYACYNIQMMLDDKHTKFSERELLALAVYRNTLIQLMHAHTPDSLHNKLTEFAVKAGLIRLAVRADTVDKLTEYRVAIEENYESCETLLVLLGELMVKHGRQQGVSEWHMVNSDARS